MSLKRTGDKIPASKTIALGRPFKVGMLYDFKTDKLIPNMLLWDEKLISQCLISKSASSTSFEIHMSSSFSETANMLEIDNNLKLSILTGLVDLSGSSKLIHDFQTTEQKQQFILRYSITTDIHRLSQKHLTKHNAKYKDIFDQRDATHFVSDILYGVEIFLVFNRKLSDNENRQEVLKSIKELLKKIKTLVINGKNELDLSNDEKRLAQTLACHYYGDIQLESNPATFKDAVELLKQVPNLLKTNTQNIKPQQALLYPLYLLDDFRTSEKKFHEIDDGILSKSLELLDGLSKLEIVLTDIKTNLSSLEVFYRTEQQLQGSYTRLCEIKTNIRKEMKKLLPEVRGNSVKETEIIRLLNKLEWLSSAKQNISYWADIKIKEINIFKKFVNDFWNNKNIRVLISSFTTCQKNFNVEFILRLTIHVTEENDPFLNELFQYFDGRINKKSDLNTKIDCWFNSTNLASIEKEIELFIQFAECNVNRKNIEFIVDERFADEYKMKKGVTTILYQNGIPVKFNIPSQPGKPSITNPSCESTTITWRKPSYGSESIRQYQIYGRSNIYHQWTLLYTTADATQSAILSNLTEGNWQFKIQGVTLAGYTDESHATDTIKIAQTLSTKRFLSNKPLSFEEKSYYDECKEYRRLTQEPLISVSENVFDDSMTLQSTSLILGVDEDVLKFNLREFLNGFCAELNLNINDIVVKTIKSGSAILEAEIFYIYDANGKKVRVKVIYDRLTENIKKDLAKMKIFFMFLGDAASLLEKQIIRYEIKLNPTYNRIYAVGHNFWEGALHDGRNRGNQPYYCPIGWQRYSFYVTDHFDEKFTGWCICYHGTKFSHGLSILLSGLKPADRHVHSPGIYVTPSINYAAHPRYSEVKRISSSPQKSFFKSGQYVQFVLECRVHPRNIRKIAKETLGASSTTIDSNIPNDVIEWVINHPKEKIVDFNDPDSSIVCTGLLTRVTDKHPGLLSVSQWWFQSHLCDQMKCCCLGIDCEDLYIQKRNGDTCNILFN